MDVVSEDSRGIQQTLEGDRAAYDAIVRRYESRIFSLICMMIKDRSSAEEVAQDTFLRAFNNLTRFDQSRPFYPWLARIAARLAINWLNRTGTALSKMNSHADLEAISADQCEPADQLTAERAAVGLWQHVEQLPSGERAAVLMFYKQELTVSEIADVLGVTSGTIKTFLYRGRQHLRTRLQQQGEAL